MTWFYTGYRFYSGYNLCYNISIREKNRE